jgi:hypothetical protein
MMNKKRTSPGNAGRAPNGSRSGPPANVAIYRGASRMPVTIVPETTVRELHTFVSLSASAGGTVDTNFTSAFGSTGARSGASNFTTRSAGWREYRILSLRVEYIPSYKYASTQITTSTTALQAPVYTVIDRNDASAATAYANIVSNASLRQFSLNQPWFREAKMEEFGEAQFFPIGVDFAQYFTIKIFSTGLSANQAYGQLIVRWMAQFRTSVN